MAVASMENMSENYPYAEWKWEEKFDVCDESGVFESLGAFPASGRPHIYDRMFPHVRFEHSFRQWYGFGGPHGSTGKPHANDIHWPKREKSSRSIFPVLRFVRCDMSQIGRKRKKRGYIKYIPQWEWKSYSFLITKEPSENPKNRIMLSRI